MASLQGVDLLGLNVDADPQPQTPPHKASKPNFLTAIVNLRLRRPNDTEANNAYFNIYHTPIQCGYNKDTSTIYLAQLFDDKDDGFFLRYIIPQQDINFSYDQERAINVGATELQLEAKATIIHETSYGSVTGNQKGNSLWIDFVRTLPEAHLPQGTKFLIKPKPGGLENRQDLLAIMTKLGIEDVSTPSSVAEANNSSLEPADAPAVVDDEVQEKPDIWSGLGLLTTTTTTDRLATLNISADAPEPIQAIKAATPSAPPTLTAQKELVDTHESKSLESFPDITTSSGSGHEAESHPISGPSWITSADVSSMPQLPERVVNGKLVPAHPWKPRDTVYKDEEWKQSMASPSYSEEEKLKRLEQAAEEFWEQQQVGSKQVIWAKADTKYSSVPRAKETSKPVEDEKDFVRAREKIKIPHSGSMIERSSDIRGGMRQGRGQRARGYGGRGGRNAAGSSARGRGAYSGTDPFNLSGGRGGKPPRGRGRGHGQDRGRAQTSSTRRQSRSGGDGYYDKGYYDRDRVLDDSVEMNRRMRSGVATYHDIDC